MESAMIQFCKNFYGHNVIVDGTLDIKVNIFHDKEIEKLFSNIRLYHFSSSTPSYEILDSTEK